MRFYADVPACVRVHIDIARGRLSGKWHRAITRGEYLTMITALVDPSLVPELEAAGYKIQSLEELRSVAAGL
jgi:hypothetical protein